MERMEPFKIRRGDGPRVLSAASEAFGPPAEVSRANSQTTMRWHFYEDIVEFGLTLVYADGDETVAISLSSAPIRSDQTLCGFHSSGRTSDMIKSFVEGVRKPWREWSEEEVMSCPMWVCLHREQTGASTSAMESMMAMTSFQRPDDYWVRRYFGASSFADNGQGQGGVRT